MADIFDDRFDNVDVKVSDNLIAKGEDINITAKDPTMANLVIGVGWTLNAFDADTLDLDVSCFLLDKNGKTRKNEDFVFYNNLQDEDESIVHNGDNLTGAGDGDDESISINLQGIPFDILKVMFVFSIYRGEEKDQNLSQVRSPYIRVINASNSYELIRYDLAADAAEMKDTAVLVASLNREGPKWHFEAIGEAVEGGLSAIATGYDIIIHEG